MGIGDEIMAAGEAEAHVRHARQPARRVAIYDSRRMLHRWHDIWEGNPYIARPGETFDHTLVNCGGQRPYIYSKGPERWIWRPYTPKPATLVLRPPESAVAAHTQGAVLVQPTIKHGASPNKQWPWASWQALVDSAPDIRWVQVGMGTEPRLQGVEFLETTTFRHACGALSGAATAVLHEGGLHHAAAAMRKRAVVIYGGFIGPHCTGYDLHTNMFDFKGPHPLGCGMRNSCLHCARAMDAITPAQVLTQLRILLCTTTSNK
jgi:hypothetical protein